MDGQKQGSLNPFDALDDAENAGLSAGPRPSMEERFKANFRAGNYQNTLVGVANSEGDMAARRRFDRYYEALPDYENFGEGAAALAGQLAGTIMTPESLIGGVGGAAAAAKIGWAGLRGRILAGAIDAAAVNAVTDAGIQGYEVSRDLRDEFSVKQLAASTAMGAVAGGAFGAAFGRGGKAPEANPFDALDDAPSTSGQGASVPSQADTAGQAAANVSPASGAPMPAAPVAGIPATKPDVVPAAVADVGIPTSEPSVATAPALEAGQVAIVRDGPVGDLPAGEMDGVPVTVSADQSGVPDTMIAVETPDGGRAVIGQNLLEGQGSEVKTAAASDSAARNALIPDAPDVRVDAPAMDGSPAMASRVQMENMTVEPVAIGDRIAQDAGIAPPRRQMGQVSDPVRSSAAVEDAAPDVLKSSPRQPMKPDMKGPERPVSGIAPDPDKPAPHMVRLADVTDSLGKLLDVAAVRQGRLTGGSKVLGQFNTRTGVMRVRAINDFDTFTHEAGHHFEMKFPPVAALIKKHADILTPLAYEGAAKNVLDREGFAEFFRLWMTNREAARAASPEFFSAFEEFLKTIDPSVSKGLDDVAKAYSDYLAQPSGQAVDSGIVSSKMLSSVETLAKDIREDGLANTIIARGDRIYTALVDDQHPLAVARQHLVDVYRENTGKVIEVAVNDDFYKLARMSRGAYGLGQADIMYGVHSYGGLDPATPSLQEAVVEAMGGVNAFSRWDDARAQAFGSYLWSRRAVGEFERFQRGEIPNPPDGKTLGDHLQNIKDKEAAFPEFVRAAPKVHEWARGLWKKKFDAGLITDEQYQSGLKIRDYVPGMRDFSGDADRTVKKPGARDQSAKAGFMRRFRGSQRDVINPIESLMADAYETANAIARNDVVRALDRMSLMAGRGAGAIAERVPTHELKAILMNPVEALDAAAKASGISPEDFATFRDAIEAGAGDSKAMIFRPAVTSERGEPIIFFRDGGKLHALRLADGEFGNELYGALTAMGTKERNFFFKLLFGVSTFVRGMITTSLDFLLINGVRDLVASVIMYGKPIKTTVDMVAGMGQQMFNADVARRYALGGGISGGESATSFADMFVRRDMSALKKKGWLTHRLSSLQGVLEFTELSETGARIGLYKRFYEEQLKRGLSKYEAHLEASYRARDYMDFSRRGSTMAGLARLVPFFNAAVQGLDKSARHMLAPIVKQMRGQALSKADQEALGTAWRTWARVGIGMTATIGLEALLRDNPDYEELSDTTKAAHWNIPLGGNWLTIPKPHEFAAFFNLAQAGYESFAKQDALAWDRWRNSLSTMLMPPSMVEGNPLLQNYFELMSNRDTFTGRDIVPEHMRALEPWLQYTHATSMFARTVGEATNTSPAIIDHLITGFGASWGRNLLALYDHYSEVKPEQGWDEAFVTRRFIKDASRGSISSAKFWDLMSRTTGRMKGVKASYNALVGLNDDTDEDAASSAALTSGAMDFVANLNNREYAYLNSNLVPSDIKQGEAANLKRRHPLRRAEDITMVLSALRRDLAMDRLKDKDGNTFPRQMRGAALDILEDLAMNETRNALILIGEPGWENKKEVPTDGYLRELYALSPQIADITYTAYVEKKIAPYKAVKEEWPDISKILMGPIGEADIRPAIKVVKDYGGDWRAAGVFKD